VFIVAAMLIFLVGLQCSAQRLQAHAGFQTTRMFTILSIVFSVGGATVGFVSGRSDFGATDTLALGPIPAWCRPISRRPAHERHRISGAGAQISPATFADLIGRDPMVRTCGTPLYSDQIARLHLTGIRGTGKTTARIVWGLNCIGPDGTGEPTSAAACASLRGDAKAVTSTCGDGRRIQHRRRRPCAENHRCCTTATRLAIRSISSTKKFMLSNSAFNACSGTLEEPPVKFITSHDRNPQGSGHCSVPLPAL
jgi:hypothetical protein